MRPTSVTIGIGVRDLDAAVAWYDAVLDMRPSLEPVAGIAEYEFGGVWIQLDTGRPVCPGWVLRYGVAELEAERTRLAALGVRVGLTETVAGVISFASFADPDGNELSCYQVLAAG